MIKHVDTPPARAIRDLGELRAAVGEELGVSAWYDITQADVDAFARLTRDTYWVHVDQQRASDTPLGGTIAHGLFMLSLGPQFVYSLVSFEELGLGLHYGYNRVRFPAPLPVGSRIRMRLALTETAELRGGTQATLTQTFERSGSDRPVCVAEALLFFAAAAT